MGHAQGAGRWGTRLNRVHAAAILQAAKLSPGAGQAAWGAGEHPLRDAQAGTGVVLELGDGAGRPEPGADGLSR